MTPVRSSRGAGAVACAGGGERLAARRRWPVRAMVVRWTSGGYGQAADDKFPMLQSDFVQPTVNNDSAIKGIDGI